MAAVRGDRLHIRAEEDVEPARAPVRVADSRDPRVARGGEATAPRGGTRDPSCERRPGADSRGLFPPHRGRGAEAPRRIRSEAVPLPEPGVGRTGLARARSW